MNRLCSLSIFLPILLCISGLYTPHHVATVYSIFPWYYMKSLALLWGLKHHPSAAAPNYLWFSYHFFLPTSRMQLFRMGHGLPDKWIHLYSKLFSNHVCLLYISVWGCAGFILHYYLECCRRGTIVLEGFFNGRKAWRRMSLENITRC